MMNAAAGIFLAASRKPRLPYDAAVEYLEGTGTQWIDTGFKATGGCKVEFRCVQAIPDATGLFVGSHNPSTNSSNYYNRNQAGISWQRAVKFNKCDKFEDFTVPSFDLQAFHVFSFDTRGAKRIGYFDGVLVVDSTTTTTLRPVNNVVMWRMQYYPETSSKRCGPGKISFVKIWDVNDNLRRDFIPVRFTNEQGVSEGAMYDRANPTVGMNPDGSARTDGLYRNRGTGAFLYGSDKTA